MLGSHPGLAGPQSPHTRGSSQAPPSPPGPRHSTGKRKFLRHSSAQGGVSCVNLMARKGARDRCDAFPFLLFPLEKKTQKHSKRNYNVWPSYEELCFSWNLSRQVTGTTWGSWDTPREGEPAVRHNVPAAACAGSCCSAHAETQHRGGGALRPRQPGQRIAISCLLCGFHRLRLSP